MGQKRLNIDECDKSLPNRSCETASISHGVSLTKLACNDAMASCKAPVVSIVMPVHNQERVLRETFNSIARQTFTDFELICVDDGSDDGSLQIELEYEVRDRRVRLFQLEHQGAALCRNFGMSKALGTYVVFLDSDDLFESDFLEKMAEALERTGADVCVCGWTSFFMEGSRTTRVAKRVKPSKHLKQGLRSRSDFGREAFFIGGSIAWNKMFRLEHILGCEAEFQDVRCSNDCLFTAKAMWSAQTVYLIDEPLVLYRRGLGTSIQDTKQLKEIDSIYVAEEIYNQIYDPLVFTSDETLSILQWCTTLLAGAVIGMASADAYDSELHSRVRDDLRKWGVMELPAAKFGDLKFALKMWLLKYASSEDVAWAFRHWGLSRDEKHTIMQKARLGVKIVVASAKGCALSGVSSAIRHRLAR